MSAISVSKWGASRTLGTSGGVVTWSIVRAGTAFDSGGFSDAATTSDLAAALPGDYLARIALAFEAWSSVANVQFIGIVDQGGSAGYRSTGGMADIRIGGTSIDGPSGTLAFAIEPGVGDILFDIDEIWTSDLLFGVALHEIGHAIGVDHIDPSVATAVMNPYLSSLDALQPGDIAAAQALYGSAIDRDVSSPPWQYVLPADVADLSLLAGIPVPDGAILWGNGLGNRMTGNEADNVIFGLGGGDVLDGGAGDDTLNGGEGDDLLVGGAGADELDGGSGTDTASYASAAGRVVARLIGGKGLAGDADGDSYSAIENLAGGNFNDVLQGDNFKNTLLGGGGNDNLNGLDGDDALGGGDGNDVLFGGAGGDGLNGGAGTDTASYTNAVARVDARLISRQGFAGDAEGDRFDSIENLFGSRFGDLLQGDHGVNVLLGGGGNDNLNGLDGDDALSGGAGNDALFGCGGNDLLTGGTGNDLFVFRAGDGVDRITDFSAGGGAGDRILFDYGAATPNSFADIQAASSQVDANTLIDLGGGDIVILLGVDVGALSADDFLF